MLLLETKKSKKQNKESNVQQKIYQKESQVLSTSEVGHETQVLSTYIYYSISQRRNEYSNLNHFGSS